VYRDLQEQRYRTHLSGGEFFVVENEATGGRLLPGVVYLEMVRAAGELAGGKKVEKIKDVVWADSVEIGKEGKEIELGLYPNGREVAYEVRSCGEDGVQVVYGTGEVVYGRAGEHRKREEQKDIEDIKRRCREEIEGQECYRKYAAGGCMYGRNFQAIKKLWCNGGEVLSLLELPEHLQEGMKEFVLHPSILEGVVQAAGWLTGAPEAASLRPYEPFRLREAEVMDVVPQKGYAYIRQVGRADAEGSRRFDIDVLTESGQVVVKMKDFVLREIPEGVDAGESARRSESNTVMYFGAAWEESEGVDAGRQEGLGDIVLFGRDEELREAIRGRIAGAGKVILVKAGEGYREINGETYEIGAGQAGDYGQLLDRLQEVGVVTRRIIHLWSKDNDCEGWASAPAQLERGVYSLFYLSKALMEQKVKDRIELLYVYDKTMGDLNIHPAPFGVYPLHAAVSGFARTIRQEHSKFIYKVIGVDREPGGDDIEAASLVSDLLVKEMQNADDGGVEFLYAEGKRYVKRIKEIDIRERSGEGVVLREQGVYLITGGAGRLGLLLAEYVARQAKVRLILSGRSDLDGEKQARIEKIESLGSEVMYVKADVSKREEVAELIREAKSRFGGIQGVIHCAGATRDSLIINKIPEEVGAVVGPKVYGTVWLDEALQDEGLEFFVMFSSISGVLGNAGQSDYAYANSFMDNFAEMREELCRQGKRQGKTLAIQWPLWAEGGMKVDAEAKRQRRKVTGIADLRTESGCEAFTRGLSSDVNQLMVIEGDQQKVKQVLGIHKAEPREAEAVISVAHGERTEEVLREVRKDLVKTVSKILKLQESDIAFDINMSSYGFDSIALTEFTNSINEKYGLGLKPGVLYEYPTLELFTGYLLGEYRDTLAGYYHRGLAESDRGMEQGRANGDRKGDRQRAEFKALRSMSATRFGRKYGSEEPIAIIGMSGILPQSENLEVFWEHIEKGDDLVREVPDGRWDWGAVTRDLEEGINKEEIKWGGFIDDVDKFDATFFGISSQEAVLMDPQQRILLEEVWKAIEDAGYRPSALSGSKTGVFVGVASTDYYDIVKNYAPEAVEHRTPGMLHSILPNRISYLLNLHGPSEPVDTACSSVLVAIHRGIQAIRNGDCDMAIAGGVNVMLTPAMNITARKGGLLSRQGRCRSFDKEADGYVRGEGAGVFLLKPLSRAQEAGDYIYGVIRGTAVNHGGYANGLTAPNPTAQAEVVIDAYEKSGIDAGTVTYIEAHGTGTSLGDSVEVNGLKKAFAELYRRSGKEMPQEAYCGIGSVKSNIGHLEIASGAASIIKVLLSMKHGRLPKTIHFNELSPLIELQGSPFYIVHEQKAWESIRDEEGRMLPRRAGISCFGLGGTNAHVILEEYVRDAQEQGQQRVVRPEVIVLSARNLERLREYARQMVEFLGHQPEELLLADIANTLQVGREAMEERLAIVAKSKAELVEKLRQYVQAAEAIEDLYSGNVKNNKEVLSDGNAEEERVQRAIEGGDYAAVAELWVSGSELDWKLLRADIVPQRIPLPTYPFERQRYWITESEGSVRVLSMKGYTAGRLHPLLDSNESTLAEQCFRKVLRGDQFYVRDHVIGGEKVLPGVVYLEMARAAGDLARKGFRVRKIRNIAWSKPIVLQGVSQEVCVSLYPQGDVVDYEISSNGEGKKKEIHSLGKIIYEREDHVASGSEYVDIEAIRNRCLDMRPGEDCYRVFETGGFTYGRSFQSIQELYSNGTEALSLLRLPAECRGSFDDFVLHPSLMDGALQTMAGLMAVSGGAAEDTVYVPFSIGEVEIINRLPETCYAFIALTGAQEGGGSRVKKFDIELVDPDGQVLVKMKDYSVRAYQVQTRAEAGGTAEKAEVSTRSVYTHTFRYDEPYLRDHVLFGEQVVLGVTHASLALEAARSRYAESTALHIRKLLFIDPIIVHSGETVEVGVYVEDRDGRVFFTNRYWKGTEQRYADTASGEYIFDSMPQVSRIDVDSVIGGSEQKTEGEELYRQMESGPVVYGSSLKTLQNVYIRGDESLGELRLTKEMLGEGNKYIVHPALLDGAHASASVLLKGRQSDDPFIPFMIKEIRVYGVLPEQCFALSRLVKVNEEVWVFDIQLCTADGAVMVVVKGFTCKRVRSAETLSKSSGRALGVQSGRADRESSSAIVVPRGTVDGSGNPLLKQIERYITGKIASGLGVRVQELDEKRNFMELGLDSSRLVSFSREIEQEAGIELQPTLFFEYPNIRELSEYFATEHKDIFFRKLQSGLNSPRTAVQALLRQDRGIVVAEEVRVRQRFVRRDAAESERDAVKRMDNEPIAIIGMSGVMPQSGDLEEFWKNLEAGRDLIGEVPGDRWDWKEIDEKFKVTTRWGGFIKDVDKFDPLFFNISPREAETMDPKQRIFLETIWETLEDAGYRAEAISSTKTGLFVGVGASEYAGMLQGSATEVDGYSATGNSPTILPNRISYVLNLHGPSEPIDTACSSSLVAIHRAVEAI
ncbi:MAG: SDR family NAD(P)-dependent oxidoreductase, partial [Methanosarcinaceae archaeon]|nr:SDR family NAD(P)-dependent oxidoreductase [Methanosarcinaceae archaeon]